MSKKNGITVTMMTVTIVIMIIIAGTITFSIHSTINYSKLSTWTNELTYIQEVVDEEVIKSSNIGFTSETVKIDVSTLTSEQIEEQFKDETIQSNQVELLTLELNKLKIYNTTYGNLTEPLDVYAYSSTTGKVYYVKGLEVSGKLYYTITDALRDRFDLANKTKTLSSVVFVPSVIGYTNEPISVTVKLPNTFTDIVITPSNIDINVSSQIVNENTYEYIVNENLVAENYTITVSYNDGTKTVISKYEVNGYDVTPPVIQEMSDDNFVYKETTDSLKYYVTNIVATDDSGIKMLKYTSLEVTEENAKEYFKQNGNKIIDGKINLNNKMKKYTIYAEDNAGNFTVIYFDKPEIVPEDWKGNVTAMVDGVPIPKGFVASKAAGENTKEVGLVIYEGNEEVTDENVVDAKKKRNQYVWIPVAREDFQEIFVRRNFNMTANGSSIVISNEIGKDFWEVELDNFTNLPLSTQSNASYISSDTLKEAKEMYSSVKKYSGFYIARYEAGIDSERTSNITLTTGADVHSKMNKIPYTNIQWALSTSDQLGGAVSVARGIYPNTINNYGVVSTLVYGVQWDAILQFLLNQKIIQSATESVTYGNYSSHSIGTGALNEGAKYAPFERGSLSSYRDVTSTLTKPSGTSWLLSTGALKASKVYNIYDMAGNVNEYTMEIKEEGKPISRGGSNNAIASRNGTQYDNIYYSGEYGFRIALYIK